MIALHPKENGSGREIDEWSELVRKTTKLESECNHDKKSASCKGNSNYSSICHFNSCQDTKYVCLLAGEIIRREGFPYVIIDFLRKMLCLRGYYCLTKENVLMQLSKYSTYIYSVESGMDRIYQDYRENKYSTLKLINENKRRILIYNIRKVLSSGVGLKYDKRPAYYINISDLNLKVTISEVSLFELKQLIVWKLEEVMNYFSKMSILEKRLVSHMAIVLDFGKLEIYSCKFEFQSFMRLIGEIISHCSPLIIDTVIMHRAKTLGENFWCCVEPIIEYMRNGSIIALFTDNDHELWDMLRPINPVDLHSRGGFFDNKCLYPVCERSKVTPNHDILIPNDYYSLDNYVLETYRDFFLSLKPKLSVRKFISECMEMESALVNKSYWIEEQKETINDQEIKEFNN